MQHKILGVKVDEDTYNKYKAIILKRKKIVEKFHHERKQCMTLKSWLHRQKCYKKVRAKFSKLMTKNLTDELHLMQQIALFAADVGLAFLVKRRILRISKRIANLADYI